MSSKVYTLNKASLARRFCAWLLDIILMVTLAVGIMFLTSLIVGYDKSMNKLNDYYRTHEVYVTDEKGNETFCELNPNDDKDPCNVAWKHFGSDKNAVNQYQKVNQLSIIILSVGLFFSIMILDFGMPLIFKNGRTIGKRLMGVSLISINEVKVTNRQIFIRALMGEFLVLAMIPTILIFLAMISNGGLIYTLFFMIIEIANIGTIFITKSKQNLPDLIAKTIPVDTASQIICSTPEELSKLKYKDN